MKQRWRSTGHWLIDSRKSRSLVPLACRGETIAYGIELRQLFRAPTSVQDARPDQQLSLRVPTADVDGREDPLVHQARSRWISMFRSLELE
jgi:hypothetical protein